MTLSTTVEIQIPRPEIKVVEQTPSYGKFAIEPLERGYAMTVGNPLRRVLLNSIRGAAITWVKIDGAMHEYSTIPHVKEDVTDLLLNFKRVRIRSHADRPGKMRLEVQGEGVVTAADIQAPPDFEIVNPELHLATLDSPEARLAVEMNVEQGKGYVPATQGDGLSIGVLPLDAIFSPMRRVNYAVERTRVGQVTDYERLVLEVWTDETISPVEALARSGKILMDLFYLFANVGKVVEEQGQKLSLALSIPADVYNMAVERLELSTRTLNCLKRAHINCLGEILEKDVSELLKIRNFGEKSLEEMVRRLQEKELLLSETPFAKGIPGGEVPAPNAAQPANQEEQEAEQEETP
ncbi:MAG: DNA-directed RNA polymerase subunit alpha [Chloroflexi bacterium]|nr:DNA-directed RNA polymerase subunit alpha [Chloroflexota bacterium]